MNVNISETVGVSIFAVVVTIATQLLVARWQRRAQHEQMLQQKEALREQLSMQELASRRIANANISTMRQAWIDELRKDISKYLTLWQEISFLWEAIVKEPSDQGFEDFKKRTTQMRMKALELQLRIELRLNMKEPNHNDLKKDMGKLESLIRLFDRERSPGILPGNVQAEFQKNLKQIVAKNQNILKDEWERVKKDLYVDPESSFSFRDSNMSAT